MSENTKIEWCDHTFNPWEGCQKVSPGCDNCYAEARNARFGGGTAVNWGPGAPRRRTSAANWKLPLKWNQLSEQWVRNGGPRTRVFCASLADVFDLDVQTDWRRDLYALIEATPHLDWLLLTKRIGNAKAALNECAFGRWDEAPLPNVWLGATIVNQAEADRDIPKLLRTPAAKRFLSMEPLLGPVDLSRVVLHSGPIELASTAPPEWQNVKTVNVVMDALQPGKKTGRRALDWVIVGGESGPNARPMHPDWVRSLRDQCAAAGVPFLFKQWGEFMPPESRASQYPGKDWRDVLDATGTTRPVHFVGDKVLESSRQVVRVGKKAAGRLLDGRLHDEFPAP